MLLKLVADELMLLTQLAAGALAVSFSVCAFAVVRHRPPVGRADIPVLFRRRELAAILAGVAAVMGADLIATLDPRAEAVAVLARVILAAIMAPAAIAAVVRRAVIGG